MLDPKSPALIYPIGKIGRKVDSLYDDHVGRPHTCGIKLTVVQKTHKKQLCAVERGPV